MAASAQTPRVALVTGAKQGIGRAIATRLAADGYIVAVNDLADTVELRTLAEQIGGVPAVADVGSPDEVAQMAAALIAQFGSIDVLVSNAAFMTMEAFPPVDWSVWWQNIETNLNGTFLLLRALLPQMVRQGFGRIVILAVRPTQRPTAHRRRDSSH
jgi:NAD(P)-dependent dehydrogenase (short-subunit alcohol dehydrogenase family)